MTNVTPRRSCVRQDHRFDFFFPFFFAAFFFFGMIPTSFRCGVQSRMRVLRMMRMWETRRMRDVSVEIPAAGTRRIAMAIDDRIEAEIETGVA